jgi:PAS domain S-box-containing protein
MNKNFIIQLMLVCIILICKNTYSIDMSNNFIYQQPILILNSYHPGYAWSDDEQKGVIDLLISLNKNWPIYVEYLDCKRYPNEKHLNTLIKVFKDKYSNKKFSTIIAMDNPALEFALKNQQDVFYNSPVIFCGINNYKPIMTEGHPDVTGIIESLDIAGTIDVMLKIYPSINNIFVIHDHTPTGLAIYNEVLELIPKYSSKANFSFSELMNMEDLLNKLQNLPKDHLVLDAGFIADKSGKIFGMAEATALFCDKSPVPVFSVFEQKLGHGIVGGKLFSAYYHGQSAAKIAIRVLSGEKISSIPAITKSDALFMFDYKIIKKLDIPFSVLPANSIIINKPLSIFKANKTLVITVLIIIVFLFFVIFFLIIINILRQKSSFVLKESEEQYRLLFNNSNDALFVHGLTEENLPEKFIQVNEVACKMLGYTEEELKNLSPYEINAQEEKHKIQSHIKNIKKKGHFLFETTLITKNKKLISVEIHSRLFMHKNKYKVLSIVRDISARKAIEARQSLLLEILKLLNEITIHKNIIEDILLLIKNFTGIEAIAIRLKDGDDCICYASKGFSTEFLAAEQKFCCYTKGGFLLKECMCDKVLSGNIDIKNPNFTKEGSFWTNSISAFISNITKEKNEVTNNICNKEGYESIALIPLKSVGKIIGLIQLNDKRKNFFTVEIIEFFERISASIAVAIEHKKTEDALFESERHLRSILETTNAGYFFIDKDGILQDVNTAWLRLYRYDSKEEIIGKHFTIVQKIDDKQKAIELVEHIMEGDEKYLLGEFSRKCRDDTIGYHTYSANPVIHSGKVIGIEGFIIDTTERKLAEDALLESEKKFRELFNTLTEGVALHKIIYDTNGKPIDYEIIDVNPAYTFHTGIKRDDVLGKKASVIYMTGDPPYFDIYSKVAQTGEPAKFETYFSPLEKYFNISVFSQGNGKFATVFEDITERKLADEILKKSLKEKEILMLEIHHRVKNSLNVILSLLKYQEYNTLDNDLKNILKKIENRIYSIALIHGLLYKSKNIAAINFNEYIKNLTEYLIQSFGLNHNIISLDFKIDEYELNIDKIKTLGLIINELITNSLKYAFKEKNDPQNSIKISIGLIDNNYILTYSDNGKGLPENFDLKQNTTSGMYLVKILCEEIDGKLTINNKNAFELSIVFPKKLRN